MNTTKNITNSIEKRIKTELKTTGRSIMKKIKKNSKNEAENVATITRNKEVRILKNITQKIKKKIMAKKQEYQLVKITCECGMEILRQSKPRHLKSKHHQNYEQSLPKD